ncbi:Late exocytosis, Golgi transport [Rhizoctonia solani]|uniref:Late exocytosis, Golgi transport n=1 Tax=Rhizoctonia solani TaxID=456999 RepID=A0A8H7I9L6_9AGAM|nr:Late exocytosis, Golgi transport [Rhizoctonia solani]
MATIETRPYSREYSGLVSQAAIASVVLGLSVTIFELMRRKRRKIPSQRNEQGVLGSVDSWEFGYLYQARCWAKVPAPPLPPRPLSWTLQYIFGSSSAASSLLPFMGAPLCLSSCHYTSLMRHPRSPRSMTRASLSSLIDSDAFGIDRESYRGNLKLLSVHVAVLWWMSLTWIGTLLWICRGAFRLREAMVQDARKEREIYLKQNNGVPNPHQGWRLRSVMVTDIPSGLRDEIRLAEYFKRYLSKDLKVSPLAPVLAPSPGIRSFAVNKLWRWGKSATMTAPPTCEAQVSASENKRLVEIEKVVLVRKTTELASLLERREEVLRRLEHAHIKDPNEHTPGSIVVRPSKSKSRPASTDGVANRETDNNQPDYDDNNPIPYALASPKARENVPRVMLAPATPPGTHTRNRSVQEGSSGEPGQESNRQSGITEYYTPATPTRPTLIIGAPPRPEPPRRPPPAIPASSGRPPVPHRVPPPIPPRTPQTHKIADMSRLDVATPVQATPPVSPGTLPPRWASIFAPKEKCLPDRMERVLDWGCRNGIDEDDDDEGLDPLGLGRRAGKPLRPSQKPLMEGESPESPGVEPRDRLARDLLSAREITFEDRDEVLERNKRLVETIGPFVYEFGLLERPKDKGKKRAKLNRQSSDIDDPLEPPEAPFKRSSGRGWRFSSGSSWLSVFTQSSTTAANSRSRASSQSTGKTLVNAPGFGFSAQVLRTHMLSTEQDTVGPSDVRQVNPGETIWDAIHSLPRSDLDAYQPLINLSALFRGRTVPAIDFFTTKLALLSALIDESRGGCREDATPASTAFVTFKDPRDARRAVKELAAHPKNVLACVVTPAPDVRDIDWGRAMKSTYTGEFVKDWVVNMGVWGFTVLWIFPVSLLVGLVSIDNLSRFIPELAHNIITFSRLHDRILTRYYKFLVCNVVIFFCIGVSVLQSFLTSFGQQITNVVTLIAGYIPSVHRSSWVDFPNRIHAGLELGLFGVSAIDCLSRDGTWGNNPGDRVWHKARTFNYYCGVELFSTGVGPHSSSIFQTGFPNHLLVVIITLLFSILNPLILPFSLLLLRCRIRQLRYSLDGLMLSQVVLMAIMLLLRQTIQAGVIGTALVLTALAKLYLTRVSRAKFEAADKAEAKAACGLDSRTTQPKPTKNIWIAKPRMSILLARVNLVELHNESRNGTLQPTSICIQHFLDFVQNRQADKKIHLNLSLLHYLLVQFLISRPRSLHPPCSSASPERRIPRLASWETFRADVPLVVPHTGREPWDDSPDNTATYDNPYYTQPVPIDLHRALTSEADGGDMTESIMLDDEAAVGSFRDDASMDPFTEFTGEEDIALSSIIRDRLDHGDVGEDFDYHDGDTSSIFSRRPSGGTVASRRLRSPTLIVIFCWGPKIGRKPPYSDYTQSASFPFASMVLHLPQSADLAQDSLSADVALPTDGVKRKHPAASTAPSEHWCQRGRHTTEERIRQELQESEHLTAPRKWTAWMYAKVTSQDHDDPI